MAARPGVNYAGSQMQARWFWHCIHRGWLLLFHMADAFVYTFATARLLGRIDAFDRVVT